MKPPRSLPPEGARPGLGRPGARPVTPSTTDTPRLPPSPLAELWRDFRRNRGAVIGLAVIVLLVLCALFADLISPYHPSEQYRDGNLAIETYYVADLVSPIPNFIPNQNMGLAGALKDATIKVFADSISYIVMHP